MSCPVCLENINDDEVRDLTCGHFLCAICLPKLQKMDCPLCRTSLIPADVKTLIDTFNEITEVLEYAIASVQMILATKHICLCTLGNISEDLIEMDPGIKALTKLFEEIQILPSQSSLCKQYVVKRYNYVSRTVIVDHMVTAMVVRNKVLYLQDNNRHE
jgi:hypothetical protein